MNDYDGEDVILVIEVQCAKQIKEKYKDAVTIFILPPSLEELINRILSRGHESLDAVEFRLKRAEEELKEVEKQRGKNRHIRLASFIKKLR